MTRTAVPREPRPPSSSRCSMPLVEMPLDRVGFRLNPMLNRFHGIVVDEDTVPMWTHVIEGANRYGPPIHTSPSRCRKNRSRIRPVPCPMSAPISGRWRQCRSSPTVRWIRRRARRACRAGWPMPWLGVAWIANPDLVERYARNAPLNAPDRTPSTPVANGAIWIIRYSAADERISSWDDRVTPALARYSRRCFLPAAEFVAG